MVAGAVLAAIGWWVPAAVAWCLAVASGVAGLWLKPSSLRRVERFIAWTAHVVGRAVTHLLLVPVFLLMIVPLGLARRRHDTLSRRSQTLPSYWKRRQKGASALDRTF